MRGFSLRNYLGVLGELRSEEVARKALSLVSRELREALQTDAIAAMDWYPVAWKRELHAAGALATGEAMLARAMGYAMTRRDVEGIYRTFVRVASPVIVLKAGARVFSRYLRPGRYEVVSVRGSFIRVDFRECYGFDRNMWLDVMGGCEAVLEAAGGVSVRIHMEAGGGDGDCTCIGTARWSERHG
jgi:hypothetical protein